MHYSQENKASFDRAVNELRTLSYLISTKSFISNTTRHAFLGEINALIDNISREIYTQCLSIRAGEKIIKEEIHTLRYQEASIFSNAVNMYAVVKRETFARRINLLLKQVGFVGGGVQMFTGGTVCAASFGLACGSFGAPLMAHGLNNIEENGYFLLYRKNIVGHTRKAYRYVGSSLGYSEQASDIAFATVDLALSAYGVGRGVLRSDARRLFRYNTEDYIRGWKEMGTIPLAAEGLVDISTMYSIYRLQEGQVK